MKILITGSSGFLGKYILNELSSIHSINELNRSSSMNFDLSKQIPNFDFKVDLVIHAAGLAHVPSHNQKGSDMFHKINVIGTYNLLKGIERVGMPRNFVFISSVSVYGQSNGFLINEESKLGAIDPYGRSKIQAERLLLDWCSKYNVKCTILRLPLVVGTNPPGNLRDMFKGIRKGYYFNIAGGVAKKSMVLATDVAKYIIRASEVGGIYNLTDGYHPSFYELSSNISNQLGKSRPKKLPFWLAKLFALVGDSIGNKCPLNSDKLRKITSDLTFDDSKARKAFVWNPTPVLEGFKMSDKNL